VAKWKMVNAFARRELGVGGIKAIGEKYYRGKYISPRQKLEF